MSQFDLISVEFDVTSSPAELVVIIDNPDGMQQSNTPEHTVPSDVQILEDQQEPTSNLWVHADHHHLTITLEEGNFGSPLRVTGTEYYNQGDNSGYVDIIIAEKKGEDKKTVNVKRTVVIICL